MDLPEFRNEPFTDYSQPANEAAMKAALEQVRGELGRTWPAWIGGEEIKDRNTFESRDPGDLDRVIGHCQDCTAEDGTRAVDAAWAAFPKWSQTPVTERARIVVDAAAALRRDKHVWSAYLVYEAGKSWREADGDTAEAIDFLEYYARQALDLAKPQPVTPVPGEKNSLHHIPTGPVAVIPPWNFPLAIMAGMTTAALVSGNTVVLKPAEQTPAIAARFVELLHQVGLPKDVLQFVPCSDGAVVGGAMVSHPRTRVISFTGSRDVGLMLHEQSAKVQKGQFWMKKLVAEMGGKDGILIDNDCDLDSAVDGVLASAYGFQGQKCSACSRAMIHQDVYDAFVEKLIPKVEALRQGHPEDRDNYAGPVIDPEAKAKVEQYLEIGRKEGKLLAGGKAGDGNGHYIRPTVFGDIAPDARLSLEEVFGPVLALIKVKDFAHGMEVANNTDYGLTGAVYSNNPDHLEEARRHFHVGNFYLNRGCTGALVGAHPFGGFKMSGTCSKAGGPDYLTHFMDYKLISEKV